jgi:Zn finger protein HypA/HybF involved in hydrogenase expression
MARTPTVTVATVTRTLTAIERAAYGPQAESSGLERAVTDLVTVLGSIPGDMDVQTRESLETVRRRALHEMDLALLALPTLRAGFRAARAALMSVQFADIEASFDDAPAVAVCRRCGAEFSAQRSDAIYCSPACRQAAYRGRGRDGSGLARAET